VGRRRACSEARVQSAEWAHRPAGPPGFTITTQACNAYLKKGEKFPPGLWTQALAALKVVERKSGKHFGDPTRPLLVSCRSGAKFSMPGMMDTVLNIGLNDTTAQGMISLTGDASFVYDSYRRLVQMYGSVVLGVADEPFEQVLTDYRKRRGRERFGPDGGRFPEITKAFRKSFGADRPALPGRSKQLHGDRSRLQVLE
jgi:pyruvate,orthophosphate dikinase